MNFSLCSMAAWIHEIHGMGSLLYPVILESPKCNAETSETIHSLKVKFYTRAARVGRHFEMAAIRQSVHKIPASILLGYTENMILIWRELRSPHLPTAVMTRDSSIFSTCEQMKCTMTEQRPTADPPHKGFELSNAQHLCLQVRILQL